MNFSQLSAETSLSSATLSTSLLTLAHRLLLAAQTSPASEIQLLIDQGAPTWFQDDELGWSCLHYAAERREPNLLRLLLKGGAVWNAVDIWGRTAGEVCLSLGDKEGWEVIRNEGVRSEMLHHALGGADAEETEGNLKLRAEDTTSAGDNLTFLKSTLRWETGEDGKERVLDEDGNGVMMGWEEPLMREHVQLMTSEHPHASSSSRGMCILNVGYGLGIVDRLFQIPLSDAHRAPSAHFIVEAHPQVLAHMKDTGVDKIPGVTILEGRWQDWLLDQEKMSGLLEKTPDGLGFDAIFVDTFAEGYEDLKALFQVLPDILEAEHGVFSFWNGLGATNATIYAVSSHLAELHLEDVGLGVEWHDVAIPESLREEVWRGVRRRYWDLPSYRLPIGRMQLC